MKRRIITLLTDFGLADPYVSSMKAVILKIYPDAQIVDISHQIGKFNINEAAFKLAFTASYFEPDTIHLVVVDPGVGSSRKPIIVLTKRHLYVGPDNGVLSVAAEIDGIERIVEITNKNMFLKPVSNTFHGRDVFAPVAAYLAKRVALKKFGPNIGKMVKLDFPKPITSHGQILGEVLYVDGFGNIITNVDADVLKKSNISQDTLIEFKIIENKQEFKLCNSYNDVYKGELLAIIGSSGYLEVSANQSSAANLLNVNVKDKFSINVAKS